MINAIAELGQYIRKENQMDFLDIILDDSFDRGRNKHLFITVFDENCRFYKVKYRELDSSYKKTVLYKRGPSSGTDFTPTSKITKVRTTLNRKFIKWFEQNKNNELLSDDERSFLSKLFISLKKHKDEIIERIESQSDFIKDKSGRVLTLGFLDKNGGVNLISSNRIFRKILFDKAQEDFKYSKTNNAFSYSKERTCSICNNEDEVFGFFTDLKFYNVDKAGMITGGFQYKNSWKNYPVCLNCALDIRNGYTMLQDQLDFSFYGLRYYFIPRISDKKNYKNILDVILNFKNNPKFKTEDIKRLTNDEEELFEFVKENQSSLSFDLFFYEKPQKSVLRILLVIEELFPSRLNVLFKAKELIDNIIFFKQARNKEKRPLCYFNFGIVRNFFPRSDSEGNKDKYFLEISEKIFKDKPINLQFVIQNIMYKVRSKFSKDGSIWLDSLKGFMFVIYLIIMKLVNEFGEVKLNKQFFEEFKIKKHDELGNKIDLFFESFSAFFRTDAHRSIFLIGVLTQFLLNIQKRDRDSSPFRSRLKGLKMSAYDISILLPEIINKLEDYGKNYYRPLEEIISKYLLSAGDYNKWRLSVDEMNFIFVIGMNLSKYFKIISEKEEEE
ncbi:MAG: TIGR02556 family CRISPR-associated protein [Candidatus Helarchaeota archaeon]